jgi:hypothetical protein
VDRDGYLGGMPTKSVAHIACRGYSMRIVPHPIRPSEGRLETPVARSLSREHGRPS